ncbi:MAG: tripartite tricarboxylate transporter TctB family protein [Candidatus Rokubacteria bacterium]|nr:tripartite tricarboxylate transporter TctB family protein [Candidatus Rokubacteria bacterium]
MAAAAPLLGIALAVALLLASRGLDNVSAPGQLGPAFWPRLVLAGLAVACLAKAVEAGRRPVRVSRPAAPLARGWLTAAIALIVLYVLVTPLLGFALATAAFIAVFLALCGTRAPLVLAVNAVAGTVALLYLFVKLVYLPLPKGEGSFELFTLALYRALGIF